MLSHLGLVCLLDQTALGPGHSIVWHHNSLVGEWARYQATATNWGRKGDQIEGGLRGYGQAKNTAITDRTETLTAFSVCGT